MLNTILAKKENSMIAPGLADTAEQEPLADQRMERMSHNNSPVLTIAFGCS